MSGRVLFPASSPAAIATLGGCWPARRRRRAAATGRTAAGLGHAGRRPRQRAANAERGTDGRRDGPPVVGGRCASTRATACPLSSAPTNRCCREAARCGWRCRATTRSTARVSRRWRSRSICCPAGCSASGCRPDRPAASMRRAPCAEFCGIAHSPVRLSVLVLVLVLMLVLMLVAEEAAFAQGLADQRRPAPGARARHAAAGRWPCRFRSAALHRVPHRSGVRRSDARRRRWVGRLGRGLRHGRQHAVRLHRPWRGAGRT